MKNKFFKTINLAFILSLAFFSSCNLDNKNLDDRDKESKKENINLTDSINPNEDKNEEKLIIFQKMIGKIKNLQKI